MGSGRSGVLASVLGGNAGVWATLAAVLPVATVLLPVAGVIARWTRFLFDPSVPSQVLLAASVPELTVTGFSALRPGLPVLLVAAIYASRPSLRVTLPA